MLDDVGMVKRVTSRVRCIAPTQSFIKDVTKYVSIFLKTEGNCITEDIEKNILGNFGVKLNICQGVRRKTLNCSEKYHPRKLHSFIGSTTVLTLAAESHMRSTQHSAVCFGAFVDAHSAHHLPAKRTMIALETERFVGNNLQLDVLKEFRVLRRKTILLDCQIRVSDKCK